MQSRKLRATECIISISIKADGAAIQRQLFERVLVLSDRFLAVLFEWLIVLDYLATLYFSFTRFCADLIATWQAGIEAVLTGVLYCVPLSQQAAG